MKNKRVYPLIPKVIPSKLFLGMVRDSFLIDNATTGVHLFIIPLGSLWSKERPHCCVGVA